MTKTHYIARINNNILVKRASTRDTYRFVAVGTGWGEGRLYCSFSATRAGAVANLGDAYAVQVIPVQIVTPVEYKASIEAAKAAGGIIL